MFSFQNIALFLTILFSGLIAGLLYSYSCSVNIGLNVLPDQQYLKAMQSINRAIQNPYFFICFMGLLLLFPIALWSFYQQHSTVSLYLMLIAASLYFIGVFGITVFGNVPLNDKLDQFVISSASKDEISAMRQAFEISWNKFHFIRTISAILSFGLAILSLFKYRL